VGSPFSIFFYVAIAVVNDLRMFNQLPSKAKGLSRCFHSSSTVSIVTLKQGSPPTVQPTKSTYNQHPAKEKTEVQHGRLDYLQDILSTDPFC
jgi:hypothetical protein